MVDYLLLAKLTYVFGITNLIGLALVLVSCRCIIGLRPDSLGNSKLYLAIYKYHC